MPIQQDANPVPVSVLPSTSKPQDGISFTFNIPADVTAQANYQAWLKNAGNPTFIEWVLTSPDMPNTPDARYIVFVDEFNGKDWVDLVTFGGFIGADPSGKGGSRKSWTGQAITGRAMIATSVPCSVKLDFIIQPPG